MNPNSPALSKGTRTEILAAVKAEGMIWVKGAARATVRKMARDGLVGFSAEAICDNRTSRSHEELHVWLSARSQETQ